MATADDVVYIKQLLLAEDIKWGIGVETQVRNGIVVNGQKVNSDHIIFNSPDSPHHGKTVSQVLQLLLTNAGV